MYSHRSRRKEYITKLSYASLGTSKYGEYACRQYGFDRGFKYGGMPSQVVKYGFDSEGARGRQRRDSDGSRESEAWALG